MKKNHKKKVLYLIPVPLIENEFDSLSANAVALLTSLSVFVAESPKTTRRLLSKMGVSVQDKIFIDIQLVDWSLIPESVSQIGLVSEAGCPCVADPGNLWVRLAHQNGLSVVPISGPSSLMMALMVSGLNGQNFAFNGYLPVKKEQSQIAILKLEKRIYSENQTQIFIETPYRNNTLLELLVNTLQSEIILCVAANLSTDCPQVVVKSINNWKKTKVDINKQPCTFVVGKY